MTAFPRDPVEAAQVYVDAGMRIVPVPVGDKNPASNGPDWQHKLWTPEHCAGKNVGVILGHGGLTDVDLDSTEALALAPYFLPETLTFGHASKPESHWIYDTGNGLEGDAWDCCRSEKYFVLKSETEGNPLIEIRGRNKGDGDFGAQTVFPGSIHKSGEPIEWTDFDVAPTTIAAGILDWAVRRLAVACILRAEWGDSRHEKSLRISAGLLRDGWTPDEVKHLFRSLLYSLGYAEGSAEWTDWFHDVESTLAAAAAGRDNLQGFASAVSDGVLSKAAHDRIRDLAKTPERRASEARLDVAMRKGLVLVTERDAQGSYAGIVERDDAVAGRSATAAIDVGPEEPPLVIQRDDRYWLRKIDAARYFSALREKDLRLKIERVYGSAFPYRNSKSQQMLPTAEFMAFPGVGDVASEIVSDFTATGNTWDATRNVMRLGYELAPVAATRDAGVEAWLTSLFGDGLDEAYEWIAACRQDRLRDLAVAMAIIGAPGCGKTVFFRGLARLWGCDFVNLGHVVEHFNSVMTTCPFWVDDECKTLRKGDLTSEEFRQLIQTGVHQYEPKGVDKRVLLGYARFGLTANEPGDLRFGDVYGASAVQAIADRLAIYRVRSDADARAALDALRMSGTDRIDLDRLAGHFAWVMDAVVPPVRRFLGARRDNAHAVGAALQSMLDGYPELFDFIGDALDRLPSKTKSVHYVEASGRLYVSPHRLVSALEGLDVNRRQKHTLERVQRALKSFRVGAPVTMYLDGRGEGAKTTKVWELDAGLLAKALPETAEFSE